MSPTYIESPKVQYRVAGGWADGLTGTVTPLLGFPTDTTVGVDAIPGWEPSEVISEPEQYMYIFEEGAVYEDVRWVDTGVIVRAPHVTFRRCEVVGAYVFNEYANHIANGMLFEDSTIRYTPPGVGIVNSSAIGEAGFTMRRSSILDVNEGVRTGGSLQVGADLLDPDDPLGYTVRIYDSYVRITGPTPCDFDYHGDGWQCSDSGLPGGGVPCRIRNSRIRSIDQAGDCAGTSCMISGAGHGRPFDIDGLILGGAGYCFYYYVGGDIRNLYFEDDSWIIGPLTFGSDIWDITTTWSNVHTAVLDEDGQPTTITGTIPQGWNGLDPLDPP
jgi:hypothetical protein